LSKVAFNDASIEKAVILKTERDAFELWFKGAESMFIEMQAGWSYGDIMARSKDILHLADTIYSGLEKSWNDLARTLADELHTKTPNAVMLNQPRLLTDESVRLALRTAVNRLFGSKMIGTAADMLARMRVAEAPGIGMKFSAKSVLSAARSRGKVAVCVNWAVDEVTKFKPEKPEDLIAHGTATLEKLKLKGMIAKELSEQPPPNRTCGIGRLRSCSVPGLSPQMFVAAVFYLVLFVAFGLRSD